MLDWVSLGWIWGRWNGGTSGTDVKFMQKVWVEVEIKEEGQGGGSGTADDGCFQGSAISPP